MKKWMLLLAATLLLALCLAGCGSKSSQTLNVYNWGEYISDGSEGSLDTVAAFEQWYEETYGVKVKVNYDTYPSNEDMYNKLKSGAISYDLVIPSDYMIAKMREEGMLLPLNFRNIPNYEYISERFRGLYYDPEDRYSVPYTYGVVGVIYNANVVDEADTGSWDLLWNEKYAGNILQFNNPRDAFGTAQYKLGLDVNSTDKADWDLAQQALQEQSPLLKGMVMDEIYNMMASGEAAIGTYYAGDYFTMVDMVDDQSDKVDLQFYYPERTNYFFDAMCIPTCCQEKEAAEAFINFLCSPEISSANMEFLGYSVPSTAAKELMDPEVANSDVAYPDADTLATGTSFNYLPEETSRYMESLFMEVRNG